MSKEWPDTRVDELKRLWGLGESKSKIARAMGTTRNAIIGKSNRLRLQFHTSKTGQARALSPDAPSVLEGRSRYPTMVRDAGQYRVLKSGGFNRKLGAIITKGRWSGFPIFALTLEERATCPRTCKVWAECYGNSMHGAIRYRAGEFLIEALIEDLTYLQRKFPGGFAVRLHNLGDFYSVEYVAFWRRALRLFPDLHVFGYTARQADDPIGQAINALRDEVWERFAIRTSGAETGPRTAVIGHNCTIEPRAIICPAQTGATSCCATCALCWSPAAKDRPIVFEQH